MRDEDIIKPLQALGFTEIEALVYGFLVENSPATGYKISHAIGKQPPNTYKAIAALEDKGAIVVEVGEKKLCRAVPPSELLENLKQRFKRNCEDADQALEALTKRVRDDRIYHLRTVDQVIQRAKAMLERAEGIALCDLFPGPLGLLAESLEKAANRGVRVVSRVYNEEKIPGVFTQGPKDRDPALDTWPGQQISIVVDGEEHLLGLISKDMRTVHEAVWSNSTFLSCMHHNNVSAEILFIGLKFEHPDLFAAAQKNMKHISLLSFRPLGLERLEKRHQRKD